MAIVVSKAVWKHSKAKGNARLVLLALADCVYEEALERAEEEGEEVVALAWPSQSTLARMCGCSRSTVELALESLVGEGEIADSGERKWGRYRGTIVWEVLPEVDFWTEETDEEGSQ